MLIIEGLLFDMMPYNMLTNNVRPDQFVRVGIKTWPLVKYG